MDSFEWNKIFGAVLGTLLFVVGLNIVIGEWLTPEKPEHPGMDVAVVETPTHDGGPVVEAAPDWGTVLPAADLAAGEKVHQRCLQCHDFSKGGPDKIGPNLYGVVGAKHAHSTSYTTYSAPMKALADKTWDYEALNTFLTNPKGAVPGTKMSFAGLSKTADRVNVIAYLRTLSDAPLAIPAPKPAQPAPAPTAPTDGEQPAGELSAPPPGSPAPATPAAPGAAPAAPAAPSATTPTPTAPTPAAPAQPTPSGGGH